jgi:phthalate 4,5-cis-dihydrodiol dehydrogenase
MEDAKRLRVGIAGCGSQGRALAEAVTRIASLRLVAGADPDAAAAATVARLASEVRTYPSVESMLKANDVDAVLVATPHHLLQPVALATVWAGKHVMAEKPIALNEQQAAAIEDAVAQKRVRYMSGYSFRFSFAKTVRDLLDAGVVGELHSLLGSIALPPMDKGWTALPETGGGPLLFVGSHLVDMALWYTGDEPVDVRGTTQRRADTGADNTTACQIHFSRGAVAQLLVTQAAPGFFLNMDLIGTLGRISLRVSTFLQFEIEVLSRSVAAYAQPTIIRPRVWRDNIAAMLVPELEEFAQAIREPRQPSLTVGDGKRVLRVLDALECAGPSPKPN